MGFLHFLGKNKSYKTPLLRHSSILRYKNAITVQFFKHKK